MASSVIMARLNPRACFLLWWSQLNLIPCVSDSDALWKVLNTQRLCYQNASLSHVSTPPQIFNAFERNWHIDYGKVYVFVMLKAAASCILCPEQQSFEEYQQIAAVCLTEQNWFSKESKSKIPLTNLLEVLSVLKQFQKSLFQWRQARKLSSSL